MLKNIRLFVSLFTSFTLAYSSYSFATDVKFLQGESQIIEQPEVVKCNNDSINRDKIIDFPFELKDNIEYFLPTNGFVDLKISDLIVSNDRRYSAKAEGDIKFQWQAKCKSDGGVEYRYKNKEDEDEWTESNSSLTKKSGDTIDSNEDYDNLFSYVSCAENYTYYHSDNTEANCHSIERVLY